MKPEIVTWVKDVIEQICKFEDNNDKTNLHLFQLIWQTSCDLKVLSKSVCMYELDSWVKDVKEILMLFVFSQDSNLSSTSVCLFTSTQIVKINPW